MNTRQVVLPVLAALVGLTVSWVAAGQIDVKSGDSIAFMGDSITAQGWGDAGGYVRLVIRGLEHNGITVTGIPAGISGHKSDDMLARLEKDVISKKPTWMTLSCGVNDVWHGPRGVALPQYKSNITAIVTKCQEAGIKVMILTATVINEEQNPNNTKLAEYNEFLRRLAKEKKCLLADLNADMWAALKTKTGGAKSRVLTHDGVHMNPNGNCLMAAGVLRTFGLDDTRLAKAREDWMNIPDAVTVRGQHGVTMCEYAQLSALAEKQNRSVDAVVNAAFADAVSALLDTAPSTSATTPRATGKGR